MAGAIARVAQFADERSHAVRLVFKDTGLDVSASSVETGESTDTVAAAFEGKPIEIGFNASYLTDFLEAVDSEKIAIHITDAKHAGEFRMAGSNEYRYVLMPMRV
jgi:DNA polymerase-3 subunit beta